jgi:hypothetical protein
MSDDEHAKEVGKAAARELLLMMGVDTSTPEGIKQAQRDFIFLRDLRVGTSAVKRRLLFSLIGAIFTALMAYVALGLRASLHN